MTATIAFDLDGTLVDSIDHIHHAVSAGLSEMALPPLTRDETQGFVGRGLPVLLQRALDHLGQSQDLHADLSDRTMRHYVDTPSDPASVYPGAVAALTALQSVGYHLTLCTNKPLAATRTTLRDVGLERFFNTVIAGDSLPTRKPEPEMLLAALGDAPRALYVGDSEVDAETASRAGIRFLLFTEGYRKAPVDALQHTATFSDFAVLPDLVARHLPD
jgi:phosphoglycolate phosphatase